MAAFCGTCGKPVVGDVKFCGGCGAPTSSSSAAQATAPAAPSPVINAAPAATGTSALKIIVILVVIAGVGLAAVGTGAYFYGRNKVAQWQKENGVSGGASSGSIFAAAAAHHARTHGSGSATLTKEEVSEIILKPVTTLEMQSENDAVYKTASPGYEASVEVERKDDTADAKQSFDAARMVTRKMFGGKGESVPGIGDDALYGANNVLFVLKNDVMLTITPPNVQMAAQFEAHDKMMSLPMGSDEQKAAVEKFTQSMKGDAATNSLSKPDATSGAVDLITHAATETGNEYETKSRLMARQLAEKVLSKMGS